MFYAACPMLRELVDLARDDPAEVIQACVIALLMPFNGTIVFAFITHAASDLLTGRARAVKPVVLGDRGPVPVHVRRCGQGHRA